MERTAVFGGTFDPPTKAHEAIIEACLAREDIDEVLVMPSGKRPDKPGMLNNKDRLRMLLLIKQHRFSDNKKLVISDFEMRLPQPTQTYQTVLALERAYPQKQFCYVFGTDSYADMPHWGHGSELQRTLPLLLVARDGYELPKHTQNVRELVVPAMSSLAISSTMVRELAHRHQSTCDVVSPEITEYISGRRLYDA